MENEISELQIFSPESTEYKTIVELNKETIFVGHNVLFDIGMISKF
jgi:DNA polymerase III epsilon subunit-like protein